MRRKQIVFEMKNKLVCLPFALAAVLGACGKTNENQDADLKPNSTDASKPAAAEPKTAALGKGVIKNGYVYDYGRWRPGAYEDFGTYAFFNDRILSPNKFSEIAPEEGNQLGLYDAEYINELLWPDAKVYYDFNPDVDQRVKTAFEIAKGILENATTVRLLPASPEATHKITIIKVPNNFITRKGYACIGYSACGKDKNIELGVTHGFLAISHRENLLNDPYLHAVILHELGHVLGLNHEMERPDRDNWVSMSNTADTNKVKVEADWGFAYDVSWFDLNSIMNYGPFHFGIANNKNLPVVAINFAKTLPAGLKSPGKNFVKFAPNTELSNADVRKISELYKSKGMPGIEKLSDKDYFIDLLENQSKSIDFKISKEGADCSYVRALSDVAWIESKIEPRLQQPGTCTLTMRSISAAELASSGTAAPAKPSIFYANVTVEIGTASISVRPGRCRNLNCTPPTVVGGPFSRAVFRIAHGFTATNKGSAPAEIAALPLKKVPGSNGGFYPKGGFPLNGSAFDGAFDAQYAVAELIATDPDFGDKISFAVDSANFAQTGQADGNFFVHGRYLYSLNQLIADKYDVNVIAEDLEGNVLKKKITLFPYDMIKLPADGVVSVTECRFSQYGPCVQMTPIEFLTDMNSVIKCKINATSTVSAAQKSKTVIVKKDDFSALVPQIKIGEGIGSQGFLTELIETQEPKTALCPGPAPTPQPVMAAKTPSPSPSPAPVATQSPAPIKVLFSDWVVCPNFLSLSASAVTFTKPIVQTNRSVSVSGQNNNTVSCKLDFAGGDYTATRNCKTWKNGSCSEYYTCESTINLGVLTDSATKAQWNFPVVGTATRLSGCSYRVPALSVTVSTMARKSVSGLLFDYEKCQGVAGGIMAECTLKNPGQNYTCTDPGGTDKYRQFSCVQK